MKLKNTLGFLVFLLSFPLFSQTIIWEENFKTGQGWYTGENWIMEGSNLQFYWSPQIVNFNEYALSPIIHLDENVEELIITQYLDVFTDDPNETAEISIVLDGEEVVLWSYSLDNGDWGNQTGSDISFPLNEYAGQDVRIKIKAMGDDSFNWNWWAIFDMRITANFDYDISVVSMSGQHSVEINEPGLWDVGIVNLGSSSISDFTVKLFCYNTGTLIGSAYESGSLAPQEVKSYLFEWSSNTAYNTVFYAVIESTSDQFEGNNGSDSYFVRINPDIDYNILVWDNDNGIQTVVDPEKGDFIRPAVGLTRVLDNAGLDYTLFTYLPTNLNDYDIVFSTMGCFCVD